MRRIVLSALAPAVLVGLASPAHAGDLGQQPATVITATTDARAQHSWLLFREPDAAGQYQIRVSFADLDLSSEAGWRAADLRVTHAVSDVCGMLAHDEEFPGYPAIDVRDCTSGTGATLRGGLQQIRSNVASGVVEARVAAL